MSTLEPEVLLVGNYELDQQESMRRFGQMLLDGLRKRGIAAHLVSPRVRARRMRTHISTLDKWLGYLDKFVLFPGTLRRMAAVRSASNPHLVIHICDHSNSIYTQWTRTRTLVTCHDLLAVRSALGEFPENPISSTGRKLQRMILDGLSRSSHVACVSEATRADLLRLAPLHSQHVTVVLNALNYPYRSMPAREARSRLSALFPTVPREETSGNAKVEYPQFILHVGGNQWYKNRPGLLRIYHRLTQLMPDAPDLVLVGKPLPTSLREWIVSHALGARIHVITEADNEQLRALYSRAAALLFPSLAEGFGWPIVEAQACDCLVVTTDRPPMSEVGGQAAVYCNPRNARESALLLQELLLDAAQEERVARRAQGSRNVRRFSTDHMIDSYLRLYRRLLAN